mmetsp:Transcript_20496/g.35363  ORF Transcript_20496/g.35363 Transcript_20496/m.35363 type:complete len:205 (+) Transcript_20496:37-651(+)
MHRYLSFCHSSSIRIPSRLVSRNHFISVKPLKMATAAAFNVRSACVCTHATDMNMEEESPLLQVKKLSPNAILPQRGSKYAAGYDLYAAYDAVIPGRGQGIVKTDIAIKIPLGTYARIAPRSGLAVKNGISTGAGVVDYDYRGNICVVLFNHKDEDFQIKAGDRVAQMILEKIAIAQVMEVDELDETERGSDGFGSTGKRKLAE